MITLTPNQIWFIKLAISHKEYVLPLSKESLSDDIFEEDYGVSKEEMIKEIEDLNIKMDKAL